MNHILLTISSIFIFFTAHAANDTLVLDNNNVYIGKVTKIGKYQVLFKANKTSYFIPIKNIYSIKFADSADKVYTNYIHLADTGKCLKGTNDAKEYHNGNIYIVAGVLLGPLAFLVAAINEPKPSYEVIMNSKNKDFVNDFDYLSCYSRAAKIKNMKKAGIGCGLCAIPSAILLIGIVDSADSIDLFAFCW